MARLLAPFTSGQVTFRYSWYNTRDSAGRCDRGALDDLLEYFTMDEVDGSPEFWWPDDRAWVVHTDIDSSYTLVGGPKALVDALSEEPELECLEIAANSVLATG